MKTLLLTSLLMIISVSASAGNWMKSGEQRNYIENVAKGIRRELYQAGHYEISSRVHGVAKALLDEHFASDDFESYLNREEVAAVYRCFYSRQCKPFFIETWTKMMGGDGSLGSFVLLDLKYRRHRTLTHQMYAE